MDILYNQRDLAYYRDILNGFVKNCREKHPEAVVVLFGGFAEGRFTPEFSDIDLMLLMPQRSSQETVVESAKLAATLFQSIYHLDIFVPIVLDRRDVSPPYNPLFSSNVLFDLNQSAQVLVGPHDWQASLQPSHCDGFEADAFYYRTWLRRQICTPSLMLHGRTFLKAILRWAKTTSIYLQRSGIAPKNHWSTLEETRTNMLSVREAFPSFSDEEALRNGLTLAPFLEGMCTWVLSKQATLLEPLPLETVDRLMEPYQLCYEAIRRTVQRPVWDRLWHDQYLYFYDDIVA